MATSQAIANTRSGQQAAKTESLWLEQPEDGSLLLCVKNTAGITVKHVLSEEPMALSRYAEQLRDISNGLEMDLARGMYG